MGLNKVGLIRFAGIVQRAGRLPDAWFCEKCMRWHHGRRIRYAVYGTGAVCFRCVRYIGDHAASEIDMTPEEVVADVLEHSRAFVGDEPVTKLVRMEARRRAAFS